MNIAVLLMGGSGSRIHSDKPKQFIKVNNKLIYQYCLDQFVSNKHIDKIILVCNDKYLSEGELTVDEIYKGISIGFESGDIAPVMCGSSLSIVGMKSLLDSIKGHFPSPDISKAKVAIDSNNEEILVKSNNDMPFSAFVFKTIVIKRVSSKTAK